MPTAPLDAPPEPPSRDLLQSILNNTFDGIITIDERGIVRSFNQAAERMFGYGAADIVGRSVNLLMPAEHRARHDGYIARYLATGQARIIGIGREVNAVRRDGSTIPINLAVTEFVVEGAHYFIGILRDLTAERGRAKALASAQRLAAILNGIDVFVGLLDPRGRLLEVNDTALRAAGLDRRDVIGLPLEQTFWMSHSPEVQERVRRAVRLAASGKTAREELSVRLAQDRLIVVEAAFAPVLDAAGQVVQIVGSGVDVTRQREIDRELERRLRQQGAIADLGSVALKTQDLDALLQAAVETVSAVLGCELCKVLEWQPDRDSFLLRAGVGWGEGLVGRATIGAGPESQAGCTLRSDKPVIVDDFRTETRFSGPPLLHEHQVLSGASVVIPGADGPFGVLGVHTRRPRHFSVDDVHFLTSAANVLADFIRRQRVESQAEYEAAFSTTLLEGLPGVVIVTDGEGRLRRWNRALETLSGYSADELEGRFIFDLVPADERQFMSDRFQEVFEHGSAVAEGHIQSRDGRRTPCLFSGRALVTDRPYLIGIALDISERRRLEDQLRQAQKMEAFGQLAGGIAHDFNNILTIILGTCEGLFAALPPQERSHADVKIIADAARRAASMTQQLLAFSRRAIVEPKIANLSSAVTDVGKMIERLIGEDVRLYRELAQDLWPVRVDPGLFTQLLINLAVNARDAMPAGGSLTIQTRNADLRQPPAGGTVPPGRYVVLTVTDTGVGMPPEIRERIFEPFFTTKPVGQGSGLGLAVVDGIVRQSGGHVDVWSESGRGTSFAIYFPAVDVAIPPPDVGATADLAGAPRGSETILLVEDEPGVRKLVRTVLEGLGYRVLEAPNGEAALRRVEAGNEPIDLLVTDVVMPGIDGRKLAEQLRCRYAGLQTLFLSGYTDDAIVRRGIIQDEVSFLQKPFSTDELARKVRDLLDCAERRPRRGHLS